MKYFHLAQIFMYWGKFIKSSELVNFRRYLSEMLSRNRVLAIFDDNNLECVLCYFLTNDESKFNNRPLWSTPPDNENGHIIFIDKMVARKWTSKLRHLVYDQVISKFPNVDQAIWLREPLNRSVIINKRGIHELHSQVS